MYTLKTKDQVFLVFKQFHANVERESSKKLKCVRTDNGIEFMGAYKHYFMKDLLGMKDLFQRRLDTMDTTTSSK